MAESEEKLKSLLIKVKGDSEKAGLKLNIHKTRIMASEPITLWQVDGGKWKLANFIFLVSKITVNGDCSHEIKRHLLLQKENYDKPSESEVIQSCPTLCDPMDYSPPGSLSMGILQTLNTLYGSTLTSIHNYWKNHSFDYTDLCQKSSVSVF